jgi:antitoxin component of RelBE/YafQ-DinJ toxin-antitoxin module
VKNITVSVDDETYRRSRIRAAEAGTSVSSVVNAFLTQFAQGTAAESEFDRLERLQQETVASIRARAGGFRAAENASRDALHERDALR